MRSRVVNLVRAVGSLVALCALVLGVPSLLLATVGNPFPDEVPTLDEIQLVLTQNGDGFGRFLVAVLALLVWFLWAQVVAALAVELIASVRRRPAPSLPTLPGIQPLVRQLVAAVTLSISLAGAPVLAPALGALQLDAVESVHVEPMTAPTIEPVLDPAQPVGPTLVLHDRTELWDLAEAAYGDGLAWTEIAAANAGLVDAGGEALSAATEVIAAGTSIRMPGSVEASSVAKFGTHVVEPGESLWTIAADETRRRMGSADEETVADYWHQVVAANTDVPSGDVDVILPGDEVTLPGGLDSDVTEPIGGSDGTADAGDTSIDLRGPEPAAVMPDLVGVVDGPAVQGSPNRTAAGDADAEPAFAEQPTANEEAADRFEIRRRDISAPQPVAVPTIDAEASTSSDEGDSSRVPLTPAVLGTAGGALLAAGLVGALRRRRALQWRQREPGRVPQRPSTEAAAFEAILAEAANQVEVSQLGNGWVAVPGAAVGRVLDAAGLVDIGFQESTEQIEGVEPGLVTAILGTDEVTNSPLLIGLGAGTKTALDGAAADIARVAQLLILDLAVSERIADVQVIAVGIGGELGDLERVESVTSWPDACVAAHRLGVASETGGSVVVVGVTAGDADSVALLGALGAASVGPFDDAQDRIRIDGATAVIEPAGIEAQLSALPQRNYELVAELVEATALAADEPVDEHGETGDTPGADVCPLAPGPVEVQVLGPVEVIGAAPFSSVKAVDVVTYLAFHRQGVDADQLKTWVWPSFEPPTDKAFANVLSRARTGLGTDPDGAPYLSRAGSDRLYRLDPEVTTDFDRLRGLIDLADDTKDPSQQLTVLQQALELVRGIPFSGGTATSFAWADNHVRSHVEFTIDETVHRCADLALQLGDHAAARAAVRTGLRVVPGCEQCFRRRFLIAGADKNRQELRSAMADLERTAAAELGEPEGIDLISRDLLMLFEELDRDLIAGAP
jgi:hypothetical protein